MKIQFHISEVGLRLGWDGNEVGCGLFYELKKARENEKPRASSGTGPPATYTLTFCFYHEFINIFVYR